MTDSPFPALVEAVDAACPCRLQYRCCAGRCECRQLDPPKLACRWPGHAAVREGARKVAESIHRPCVEGGEKCPRGCGATLKTTLDRQLHVCDLWLTTRKIRMGDRQMRTSVG